MSWTVGRGVFMEIWPILKSSIDDEDQLEELVYEIMDAFGNFDVDIQELEGFDPELDKIIERSLERAAEKDEWLLEIEKKAAKYDKLMKDSKIAKKKKISKKKKT